MLDPLVLKLVSIGLGLLLLLAAVHKLTDFQKFPHSLESNLNLAQKNIIPETSDAGKGFCIPGIPARKDVI